MGHMAFLRGGTKENDVFLDVIYVLELWIHVQHGFSFVVEAWVDWA